MNSETRMAYGSRISRQGSLRPFRRYQFTSARRERFVRKATDEHGLTQITDYVLPTNSGGMQSVLICGLNEFVYASAFIRAGDEASRTARTTRVRIFSKGIPAFFCTEEQAQRRGLLERTEDARAGPGRGGVRAI